MMRNCTRFWSRMVFTQPWIFTSCPTCWRRSLIKVRPILVWTPRDAGLVIPSRSVRRGSGEMIDHLLQRDVLLHPSPHVAHAGPLAGQPLLAEDHREPTAHTVGLLLLPRTSQGGRFPNCPTT